MWSAIKNIPLELLERDIDKVYTKDNDKIIIFFLDENYNITDVDKKTYKEWINSDKISQEDAKILDVKNFVTRDKISQSRKGFGGQFGLSSLSPLHFKLSDTYLNHIKTNKILSKLDNFIKSFILEDSFDKNFRENIKRVLENIFLDLLVIHNNDIKIKSEKNLFVEPNDFVLIKIPSKDIEAFIKSYNSFIFKVISSSTNIINSEGTCFICSSTYKEGYLFPLSNFEKEQRKHVQILHSFYGNVQYYPNIRICKQCYFKIRNLVLKSESNIFPIPLNFRGNSFGNFIFNRDLNFLDKLKEVFKKNENNPFDYIIFFLRGNDTKELSLDYVPNFDFFVNDFNKEVLALNINRVNNSELFLDSNIKPDKKIFLSHISLFFVNKLKNNLLKENKDVSINDSFLKSLFLEYKKPLFDFIFKNETYFQKFLFKKLLKKILLQGIKTKVYFDKKSFSLYDWKKLFIYYYLYYKGADVAMELNCFKKIESNIEEVSIDTPCEAAYFFGQAFFYLLSQTKSNKPVLHQLKNVLLGVKFISSLKKKLIDLTVKQSHIFEKANNKKWRDINEKVLRFSFETNRFEDIVIPFFVGFYSKNIFYESNNKNKKGDVDE